MSSPETSSAGGLRTIIRGPVGEGPMAGRRLVLVHGAMDRATSFTRLMGQLRDATVIAYDRRGYGQSFHLPPPEGFEVQIEDLVEILGGRPAVAFGHSFGADVVLATMSRRPGLITAAVVWEPPQPWLAFWPADSASRGAASHLAPEDRAEWFMRRMVGDRVWERLPATTRAARRAEGRTLEAELGALSGNPLFDPVRITVPVIVGRGGRSRVHHRRAARELAATLPDGELAEIHDAGHGAHLSHPGEVAGLIRRVAASAAEAVRR